jgi:C-terminal processing protease CtpA/Prc
MKRSVALAAGIAAAVLGLALGPALRADDKASEEKKTDKKTEKVEKQVIVHVEAADADAKGPKVERKVVIRQAGGGGFLGVGIEDVKGDARGANVRSVEKDSPAEKAGLKEGDVVVRFDGEAVRSAAQLRRLVGETPAERVVAIEVNRGGATQKLSATLVEREDGAFAGGDDFPGMRSFRFELPEPPEPPAPPHASGVPHPPTPPRAPMPPHAKVFRWDEGDDDMLMRVLPGPAGPRKLGIQFIDMGEQLAAAYKLQAKSGVLVTSVDEGGPAAKAGLKAGDVILKFQGKTVADAGDLREAVASADGGSEVTLTVQREGRALDLKAILAKPEVHQHRSAGIAM